MQEIPCPRCGLLLSAHSSTQVCPHCGKEVSVPIAKLRSSFARYWWVVLCMTLFVSSEITTLGPRDWRFFVVAGLIFAGGVLWAYYIRDGRDAFLASVAALNLVQREQLAPSDAEWQVRPPETPRQWEKLLSLPAPRQVYLTKKNSMRLWLVWVSTAVICVLTLDNLSKRGWRHISVLQSAFFLLAYVAVPLWMTIMSIRREWSARELLRDGEVTIGCWGEKAYHFWTRTGERFEHWGEIISSDDDVLTDPGLVPVFYSRDDPSKSVALCCIWSRVRVPSVENLREHRKFAAER